MTLAVRAPGPADVAAVVELGNAFDLALAGDPDWTAADLESEWRGIADLERDAFLVHRDGEPAGYATVRDDGGGVIEADGYVHPGHFGHGVGVLLVELTERRAAELAGPAAVVRNAVLHADEAAGTLLRGRGYVPVRRFMRMRIDMREPPPAPRWPEGIAVGRFRPDADAAAVHACVEEAFAKEWSHRPETLEGWSARTFDDRRFDPALWIVARERDEVCGVALSTDGQFGIGFVNALAVRAPWRRRGLGLALLHAAFAGFWARGQPHVGLGVDSDNPTGARRLYERAGMHVVWQADVYERRLRG